MAEEKNELFKVDELRPLPFSKTVTLFDVYETDEENFEPYISPLATVGTLPSTATSSSETQTNPTEQNTEENQEQENSGILGMGTGIL